MNRDIVRTIRLKRRLWGKGRGGVSEEYKKPEKKVKNMIRNAKRSYEKKLATDNNNKRPFYAYLRGKTKARTPVGPLRDKDNKVIADSTGMANILNKYFCSVFTTEDTENVPTTEQQRTD